MAHRRSSTRKRLSGLQLNVRDVARERELNEVERELTHRLAVVPSRLASRLARPQLRPSAPRDTSKRWRRRRKCRVSERASNARSSGVSWEGRNPAWSDRRVLLTPAGESTIAHFCPLARIGISLHT